MLTGRGEARLAIGEGDGCVNEKTEDDANDGPGRHLAAD